MNAKTVVLPGSDRQPVGTRVGDQPGDEMIEVSIILKPKSRATVPQKGGTTLSREEFGAKHGADPAVIARVQQFAKENNLTVSEISPERRTVIMEATAANMLRAFEVKLDRYEHEGHQYRARTGSIKLPSDLVQSVEAVLGLDNRPQARTHFRVRGKRTPKASAAAGISYTPPQVAQLYQFPSNVDGTGQTVGILELGGGYHPADLKSYFSSLGVTPPKVTAVSVDKGKNKPTNPNGADGEVFLDIEVVGAVAPGANIVVYFAPNTSQGLHDALTKLSVSDAG